jgi:hypothetical protein
MQDSILAFQKEKKMRKFNEMILVSLTIIVFAAAIGMAGVTEIKLYSNEVPTRYHRIDGVFSDAADDETVTHIGNRDGTNPINSLWAFIDMNGNQTAGLAPPNILITDDAAAGPYALHFRMCGMPTPSIWGILRDSGVPGYSEPLDASSTDRVTFWIRSDGDIWEGSPVPHPLCLFLLNTIDVPVEAYGTFTPIGGETIIQIDDFGFFEAASLKPFNGEWQFVSIPWEWFSTVPGGRAPAPTLEEAQAIVPYSYVGMDGDKPIGGDGFVNSKLTRILLQSENGLDRGGFPFTTAGPIFCKEYTIDEICLTLAEGRDVTDVDGKASVMPLTYDLRANYPNPFNPSTTIEYAIPVSNHVSIEIFNELGVKVRTLVNRHLTAGTYQAAWNATDDHGNTVPSGVYFYEMKSSHYISVQKMILMK